MQKGTDEEEEEEAEEYRATLVSEIRPAPTTIQRETHPYASMGL